MMNASWHLLELRLVVPSLLQRQRRANRYTGELVQRTRGVQTASRCARLRRAEGPGSTKGIVASLLLQAALCVLYTVNREVGSSLKKSATPASCASSASGWSRRTTASLARCWAAGECGAAAAGACAAASSAFCCGTR